MVGEVDARTTSLVQTVKFATDRKVGYLLTLRIQIPPPRETLDLTSRWPTWIAAPASLAALSKVVQVRLTALGMHQDASCNSVAIPALRLAAGPPRMPWPPS